MLTRFTIENYKSFVDKTEFSMIKASKQKGLDYSLIRENYKSKTVNAVCSSVIYGANASGKTNIIGAMDVLRSIVLRGNIKNLTEISPNFASMNLSLIPNNQLKEKKNVKLGIEFLDNDILINYELEIDLGIFLESDYNRKIIRETLCIDNNIAFERLEKDIKVYSSIKPFLPDNTTHKNFVNMANIAENSLNDEELFLTNGFKVVFAPKLVEKILEWFNNKFVVIYSANSLHTINKFSGSKEKKIYVNKAINEGAKLFGINSNALGFAVEENDKEAKLCSVFDDKAIPFETFESYGTVRFINIFPIIIQIIKNGGILVIDEFDASIHPTVLMSIINIFHNDDINKNHAQLIFNTHNPMFLNSNLFRRDEIKFVERDEDTHFSSLYSLSDFGTSGKGGVRKETDYMKNYLSSQYGAINDIDLTPIFEEIMDSEV